MKRLAAIAALVALGGVAGWASGADEYAGRAIIEFAPHTPRILYGRGDQTPLFDAYTESMTRQLASRRVVDEARDDPALARVLDASSLATHEQFVERLTVRRLRRSGLVEVTFVHESPEVARVAADLVATTGVAAIVRGDTSRTRLDHLNASRAEKAAELARVREQLIEVTEGIGVEAVKVRLQEDGDALERLQGRIDEIDFQIEQSGASANIDLRERRRVLTSRLDEQREELGALEQSVARAHELLARGERLIDERRSLRERIVQLEFEGPPPARARLVAGAELPTQPSHSNRLRLAGLGALIGLGFGVGASVASRRLASP